MNNTANINFVRYNREDENHLMVAEKLLLDKEMLDTTGPLINNVLSKEEDAFLIEKDGVIVGAIDFNEYNGTCYVAYGILKEQRGKGDSIQVLNRLKAYIPNRYPNSKSISLRIEMDNAASVAAAEGAAYTHVPDNNSEFLNYNFQVQVSRK